MDTIPPFLPGLWASEDGRTKGDGSDDGRREGPVLRLALAEPALVLATVWAWAGGPLLARDREARWTSRTPGRETSRIAHERLDRLVVELEEPGLGPTWELLVGARVTDPAEAGGLQWGPVRPDSPVSDVRLFTQMGGSLYEAVLGWYDPAAEEERERHAWAQAPLTFRRIRGPSR